jgi:hypothetical protein
LIGRILAQCTYWQDIHLYKDLEQIGLDIWI